MKDLNKSIGGIFIVAGTTIGAGMLAAPLVSAKVGLLTSIIVLLLLLPFMLYAALIALEINLYFGKGLSVSLMAKKTIGKTGAALGAISIAWLFYALLTAYTSGAATLLSGLMVSTTRENSGYESFFALLIVVVLGLSIFFGNKWADYTNRFFFLLKTICFVSVLWFLFPHIKRANFSIHAVTVEDLALIIPVFFTTYGFHGSIPPLVDYLKRGFKKTASVFSIGTSIPFIFYTLWIVTCLGCVPESGPSSFQTLQEQGGGVDRFLNILSAQTSTPIFSAIGNLFALLAIFTSFIGVGMGLFNFIEESLSRFTKKKFRPILSAGITFLPPLLFNMLAPDSLFVSALGFAAIALSILAIILPCWVGLHLSKHSNFSSRLPLGKLGIYITFAVGIGVILLELFRVFS